MKPSDFINKNEKECFFIEFNNGEIFLNRLDVKKNMDSIKKKLDKKFIDKEELIKKIKIIIKEYWTEGSSCYSKILKLLEE